MPLPKSDDETKTSHHGHGHHTLHINDSETDIETPSEYFDSYEIHSAAPDSFSDAKHRETSSQSGDFIGDIFTPHEDSDSTYPTRRGYEGEEEYSTLYPQPTFEEPWLPFDAARSLFCTGAPNFEGLIVQAAHIPHGHTMCFAMVGIERQFHSAEIHSKTAFSLPTISLSLYGPIRNPWDTLEQPSMMHAFGMLNGTTTLSRQVNALSPALPFTEIVPQASARYLDSGFATDRLMDLQTRGLNRKLRKESSYLYNNLLRKSKISACDDNDFLMEEIFDLVAVLCGNKFMDFGYSAYQVTADHWLFEEAPAAPVKFFAQLVLSVELYLRIEAQGYTEDEKYHFFSQIPPKAAWSLALAALWLNNIKLEAAPPADGHNKRVRLVFRNRQRQIEQLYEFAQLLDWSDISNLEKLRDGEDIGGDLFDKWSAETTSYLSGVILPGPSTSWLMMRALLDCSLGINQEMDGLRDMHPSLGFQYRGTTYWYWECIVGKVIGAATGVNQAAGWIGPAPDVRDLPQIQCIKIDVAPAAQILKKTDVKTMLARSNPLGPEASYYSMEHYERVSLGTSIVVDTIKFKDLDLTPVPCRQPNPSNAILVCQASLNFKIHGNPWPLRLRYDVNFIAAAKCLEGPHSLWRDYRYRVVKVDELPAIRSFNGIAADQPVCIAGGPINTMFPGRDDSEKYFVLVIDARGKADNEVFARGWCSHMDLSVVMVDVGRSCTSCGVREAYAACIPVVVVTHAGSYGRCRW